MFEREHALLLSLMDTMVVSRQFSGIAIDTYANELGLASRSIGLTKGKSGNQGKGQILERLSYEDACALARYIFLRASKPVFPPKEPITENFFTTPKTGFILNDDIPAPSQVVVSMSIKDRYKGLFTVVITPTNNRGQFDAAKS